VYATAVIPRWSSSLPTSTYTVFDPKTFVTTVKRVEVDLERIVHHGAVDNHYGGKVTRYSPGASARIRSL
jgi:hypothetical protein